MNLKFPPLSGGTVSGLNDAGIETFEGDCARNVVRECAQNSLDAAADPDLPVEVRIDRLSLPTSDLPFIPELRDVIRRCADYWKKYEKAQKFFAQAAALADGPNLDAIKISDFGTTGVGGDDEDVAGRWFGLVKSRGVSNHKGPAGGGAFGIGKDAPLSASPFRTVLYSSRTADGEVALQGVCRLVTHQGRDGVPTQGTGFIGDFDPTRIVHRAIRDTKSIPQQFLRTEPGLDVWILGSRLSGQDWAQPFVRSVLANFWPAVARKKISFHINGRVIDHSSLATMMRTESADGEVAKAIPFYQSLTDRHAKQFSTSLPNAGECQLHLLLARRDLPKKICMVRRTGMVIEPYSPRIGYMPFSGLMVCEGEEGNRLLRMLEPPRHDKWDVARGEDEPRARRALKEIKDWIKDELKNQTPHAGQDQFNESDLPPELLEEVPETPLTDEVVNEAEPDLGGNPKNTQFQEVRIRSRALQESKNPGATKAIEDEAGHLEHSNNGDGKKTGGRKGRKGEGPGASGTAPKKPAFHV